MVATVHGWDANKQVGGMNSNHFIYWNFSEEGLTVVPIDRGQRIVLTEDPLIAVSRVKCTTWSLVGKTQTLDDLKRKVNATVATIEERVRRVVVSQRRSVCYENLSLWGWTVNPKSILRNKTYYFLIGHRFTTMHGKRRNYVLLYYVSKKKSLKELLLPGHPVHSWANMSPSKHQ